MTPAATATNQSADRPRGRGGRGGRGRGGGEGKGRGAPAGADRAAADPERPERDDHAGGVERGRGRGGRGGGRGGRMGGGEGDPNRPQPPTDPVIGAEIKRISDSMETIRKQLAETAEAMTGADQKRVSLEADQSKISEELKKTYAAMKVLHDEMGIHRKQMKHLGGAHKQLIDQAMNLRKTLSNMKGYDKKKTIEEQLWAIDHQIKELDYKQSTTTMTLAEDRVSLNQRNALLAAKKQVKEYADLQTALDSGSTERKAVVKKLEELEGKVQALKSEEDVQKKKQKELSQTYTTNKEATSGLFQKRKQLRAQMSAEHELLEKQKKLLYESRQQWYEQQRAVRKQEYDERNQRRKEAAERRTARDQQRRDAEAAKLPYDEELELCDQLVKYMTPFLPQVEPVADEAETSEANGGNNKKKKAKKPAKGDIKHQLPVFVQFEALSIVPPAKTEEVAKAIASVKDKKAHYEKLREQHKQEQEKKRREAEEKRKADEAAQEEAAKEEASKEVVKEEDSSTEVTAKEEAEGETIKVEAKAEEATAEEATASEAGDDQSPQEE